jgi:hypothetical protein
MLTATKNTMHNPSEVLLPPSQPVSSVLQNLVRVPEAHLYNLPVKKPRGNTLPVSRPIHSICTAHPDMIN